MERKEEIMMKRAVLVLVLLLLLTPARVFAAEPACPELNGDLPDCDLCPGMHPPLLSVNASSPDGGTLEYQWYSSATGEMSARSVIEGATGPSYRPAQQSGTMYYCVEIRNTDADGQRSAPVCTRLARVSFSVVWTSLRILSVPDRLEYTCGETLDLTGLCVRLYYPGGYMDFSDGEGVEVTREPLNAAGEQKIRVRCGDVMDVFYVTVTEPPAHVHSYPDGWETVSAPSCTAEGIRERRCACGFAERESIPASGHVWVEGGAAADSGEFFCEVCGVSRPETPRSTEKSVSASSVQKTAADAAVQPQAGAEEVVHTVVEEVQTVTFRRDNPWKLAMIFAVIFALLAAAAVFFRRKKG